MALADAWWMQKSARSHSRPPQPTNLEAPHRNWPWTQSSGTGLSFSELEGYIRGQSGRQCSVDRYRYIKGASSRGTSLWKHSQSAKTTEDLVKMLRVPEPDDVNSTLYLVSDMSAEVVQALGHYLKITPRFFNLLYAPLSMGNYVEQYMFFGVQVMERYNIQEAPLESLRSDGSPHYRFRNAISHASHEWHVTRIALIFIRVPTGSTDRFNGIIQLDPKDRAIAEGLKILMVRDEEIALGNMEERVGLGQILSEVMYILTYNWDVFVKEAESHLRILSKRCVDEDLSSSDQLRYTRELHQMTPLWAEVRQRLIASRDLATNITKHPFFIAIKAQESIDSYVKSRVRIFDDLLQKTEDLDRRTNNLISLIFNITTLQDTRAAVEEGKAANAFAASIHRITSLTFVYLPLTLAASIYGMNIRQITGDDGQGGVWQYVVLSLSLMAATFAAWFAWSMLWMKWRVRRSRARFEQKIPMTNL